MAGGGVTVGIRANPDGTNHAAYGGLGTCGSVWSCVQCGAKVATRRAGEMADVMRAVDQLGGSAFLVTLTMRHARGDRLGFSRAERQEFKRLTDKLRDWRYRAELGDEIDHDARAADEAAHAELAAHRGCWDAVSDGWARVTSGKVWDRDVTRHGGLLGWAKVVETTRGSNGWHVHLHALICFADDVPADDLRPLVERMFTRWRNTLRRHGFDASGDMGSDGKIPGWDVRRAQLGDGDLADYFMKMAHEITSAHRKEARRPGGRTPMSIARDAVDTYSEPDVARWWEWQDSSEGRKQISWSGGPCRAAGCLQYRRHTCRHPGHRSSLRDRAVLPPEQTDEEVAAETLEADDRVGLPPETWGWVRAATMVTALLDLTEDHGIAGLTAWLDRHGQTYVLSTPAVLRERTPAGRRLRRGSDCPPRWKADARAVLTSEEARP